MWLTLLSNANIVYFNLQTFPCCFLTVSGHMHFDLDMCTIAAKQVHCHVYFHGIVLTMLSTFLWATSVRYQIGSPIS